MKKTDEFQHWLDTDTTQLLSCELCDQYFKTEGALKSHQSRKHKNVNKETLKFTCEHCKKRFNSERDMKRHVYKQHNTGTFEMWSGEKKNVPIKMLKGYHSQIYLSFEKSKTKMRNFKIF